MQSLCILVLIAIYFADSSEDELEIYRRSGKLNKQFCNIACQTEQPPFRKRYPRKVARLEMVYYLREHLVNSIVIRSSLMLDPWRRPVYKVDLH